MISLNQFMPPGASGEGAAVYALLQVIADPKAAKEALDKMEAKRKEIDNATEKQQKMIHDADAAMRKQHHDLEKQRHENQQVADKAHLDQGKANNALAAVERKKAEVDATEKRIAEQQLALDERSQKVKAEEDAIAARMRDVSIHERDAEKLQAKLERHEADLDAREKRLQADIDENMKWLAGLKPPRGR